MGKLIDKRQLTPNEEINRTVRNFVLGLMAFPAGMVAVLVTVKLVMWSLS